MRSLHARSLAKVSLWQTELVFFLDLCVCRAILSHVGFPWVFSSWSRDRKEKHWPSFLNSTANFGETGSSNSLSANKCVYFTFMSAFGVSDSSELHKLVTHPFYVDCFALLVLHCVINPLRKNTLTLLLVSCTASMKSVVLLRC